jgi:predicted nuclease of predicted toxin-antitoxin system
MTFLLDHDVPDDLGYALLSLGYRLHHLRDVLPRDAKDSDVLEYACEHLCVLISCNRDDFIELGQKLSHHGIIILIRRKSRTAERAALIRLLDNAGEAGITGNVNFA